MHGGFARFGKVVGITPDDAVPTEPPLRPLRILMRAHWELATRDFLNLLNERHAAENPGLSELEARMNAYQLAARMQLSAPEALDLAAAAAPPSPPKPKPPPTTELITPLPAAILRTR